MAETKKVSINQYNMMKEVLWGAPEIKEGLHQLFTEVRVVSEPGARAFEQEVNRLLQEGWIIMDAKVVSQSMHNPETKKVCESSRLRAILGRTSG